MLPSSKSSLSIEPVSSDGSVRSWIHGLPLEESSEVPAVESVTSIASAAVYEAGHARTQAMCGMFAVSS